MNKTMTIMRDLIEEISMGPFGSDIKVENFKKSGVPVLNGANVSGVKLKEGYENFLTPEKADSLKKANVYSGDIVVTHRGTLGQLVYIPFDCDFDRYVISQSQFKVRLKTDKVDPIYFSYYFHTSEGQKRLLSFKNHVGVPALAQATTNFRLLEFPLIPIDSQKRIAKILCDLDTKIDLNNAINLQLESMAKLIYDYWFVQFDFPDENGKPYKSSGGKMVYNKELKREIPENWNSGGFERFSEIKGGSTPSKSNNSFFTDSGKGLSWITPKDLSNNTGNVFIKSGETDVTEEGLRNANLKILPKGSILMSSRAPIGYVAINSIEATTNQGFKSFVPKEKNITEFLYFTIKSSIPIMEQFSSGSTFKEISASTLKTIQIAIPPESMIDRFSQLTGSIFKSIELREQESDELAKQRDWLLPMLMNGQVRIKD